MPKSWKSTCDSITSADLEIRPCGTFGQKRGGERQFPTGNFTSALAGNDLFIDSGAMLSSEWQKTMRLLGIRSSFRARNSDNEMFDAECVHTMRGRDKHPLPPTGIEMTGQKTRLIARCACAFLLAMTIIASSVGCALPGSRTGTSAYGGPPAGGTMS